MLIHGFSVIYIFYTKLRLNAHCILIYRTMYVRLNEEEIRAFCLIRQHEYQHWYQTQVFVPEKASSATIFYISCN